MGTDRPRRILILGGGFGGLYTALELEKAMARDPYLEVTLVNRENFFLFTPMLHEVAASDLDITHIVNPIRKVLQKSGSSTAKFSPLIFHQGGCASSTARSVISTRSTMSTS